MYVLRDILRISAHVLCSVIRGRSILSSLSEQAIPPACLSAVRFTVFDAVRHLNYAQAVLALFLHDKRKKRALFFDSLMIVALVRLDADPSLAHAVVDQTVHLVSESGQKYLSRLANALLRRYLRERDAVQETFFHDPCLRYRLPSWWLTHLKKDYPEQWASVAEVLLSPPPMCLRVNQKRLSVAAYQEILDQKQIEYQNLSDVLWLKKPCAQKDLPCYEKGYVSVQDYAAQKICSSFFLKPQDRFLDACAGSGGKLCAILERSQNNQALAIDCDRSRLDHLESDLQRLGLTAQICCADLLDVHSWWDGVPFDAILLDAPCSGSGSLRRHICAKWHKREDDLLSFVRVQSNMLMALWPILKRGGRMVYVTCSLFSEENVLPPQMLVNAFSDVLVQEGQTGPSFLPTPYNDGFFCVGLTKK